VAKSLHDSCVCGMEVIFLKAGKRYAVVVFGVWLAGSDDAVITTLWNGCYRMLLVALLLRGRRERTNIERLSTFAYHTFQALDKVAGGAIFLLDIALPIFLTGAENDLFSVCGHCVEERCLAIDVEIGRRGGAFACWRGTC
jgi:hypothetical protein